MMRNTKIYLVTGCYGDWNNVYIGKTINNSRKNDHRRKYGKDIDFETLEEIEGTNKELWKPRESYWIQYYLDSGFVVLNKQKSGGSGVEFHTEETIEKIKNSRKKNRHRLRKDVENKKDEIVELYKGGKGPHILGKQFNCHPDVIKRILRESNTPLRTKSESQKCRKGEIRRKDLWDRMDEIKLLYSQGMNYASLGRMFNTSGVQIRNIIKGK